MNGSLAGLSPLVSDVRKGSEKLPEVDVAICPPFVYLAGAAALLEGSAVGLGGQNLAVEAPGAFTGEVAGEMLKDVGCQYVIVGHSERRALYGETSELVAAKVTRAQACGLTPIICVGESEAERTADETEAVVGAQIDAVIDHCGIEAISGSVLAYEPVWAIGTGLTASPEQAQAVHAFIRARLAGHSASVAEAVRILYGGSVKPGNAAQLFEMDDIDGGLIGGASLAAEDFLGIVAAGSS